LKDCAEVTGIKAEALRYRHKQGWPAKVKFDSTGNRGRKMWSPGSFNQGDFAKGVIMG